MCNWRTEAIERKKKISISNKTIFVFSFLFCFLSSTAFSNSSVSLDVSIRFVCIHHRNCFLFHENKSRKNLRNENGWKQLRLSELFHNDSGSFRCFAVRFSFAFFFACFLFLIMAYRILFFWRFVLCSFLARTFRVKKKINLHSTFCKFSNAWRFATHEWQRQRKYFDFGFSAVRLICAW